MYLDMTLAQVVALVGAVAAVAGLVLLLFKWDSYGVGADDLALGAVLVLGGLLLRIEAAIRQRASAKE
jgi:hypothetical protein